MFDGAILQGYITSDSSGNFSAASRSRDGPVSPNAIPLLAHTDSDGRPTRVQAMVIDERSRYLISGDSNHEIHAWKKDTDGWYCLQRRFPKDPLITDLGPLGDLSIHAASLKSGMGVTSLTMHPDKGRSQLLALSQTPSGPALRMLSTSTYKQLAFYSSGSAAGVFGRATLSADGKYSLCGTCSDLPTSTQPPRCHVRLWDTASGLSIPCALADAVLPYPVRSLSWHPRQHMVAVAMVGPGAAVAIYTGERESSTRAVSQLYNVSSLGLGFDSNAPESSETDSLTGIGPGAGALNITKSSTSDSPNPMGTTGKLLKVCPAHVNFSMPVKCRIYWNDKS